MKIEAIFIDIEAWSLEKKNIYRVTLVVQYLKYDLAVNSS